MVWLRISQVLAKLSAGFAVSSQSLAGVKEFVSKLTPVVWSNLTHGPPSLGYRASSLHGSWLLPEEAKSQRWREGWKDRDRESERASKRLHQRGQQ